MRYQEFGAVLTYCPRGARALDVGSPKLLARLLAVHKQASAVVVDVSPTLARELRIYSKGKARRLLSFHRADAQRLPYADDSFDFVCSVSVLEHIAEEGDFHAVQEMARVLKPGSRAVITTPVEAAPRDIWRKDDPYGGQVRAGGMVFFSRVYTWETLETRITGPSGLALEHAEVWRETTPGWYARYTRRTARAASPISIWTKLFDPWNAYRRFTRISDPRAAFDGRGFAVLVLRKRATNSGLIS